MTLSSITASLFTINLLVFACLDSWTEKPAFGTGLDEHLKRSGREIALPLEACVMMLLETGMKEEVRMDKKKPAPFLAPHWVILLD